MELRARVAEALSPRRATGSRGLAQRLRVLEMHERNALLKQNEHHRASPEVTKPMRKSPALISEVIRETRLPLRGLEDRPHKSQKHRYERRKVRECLRLTDWMAED